MAFNDFATTWLDTAYGKARLAGSLKRLAGEIALAYPQATFLGALGNQEHVTEGATSDHNPIVKDPYGWGVVRALDIGGPDAMLKEIRAHFWKMYAAKDARLWHYGYSKGTSDNQINNWPPADITGHHTDTGDAGHLHISVTQKYYPSVAAGYIAAIDSEASWGLFDSPAPQPEGDDDMANMYLVQMDTDHSGKGGKWYLLGGPDGYSQVASTPDLNRLIALGVPKLDTGKSTDVFSYAQHQIWSSAGAPAQSIPLPPVPQS